MGKWWQKISGFFFLTRYTVTRKIAVAYLLITLFSLVSIIYALTEMRSQTRHSNALVQRDFQSFNLTRDLRSNLLAQERLEQQYLILKDKDLLFLLEKREEEFVILLGRLAELPLAGESRKLLPLVDEYRQAQPQGRRLLEQKERKAEAFVRETLSPLRAKIIAELDDFAVRRSRAIDASLLELVANSRRAYRVTMALLIFGIGLSTPVGVSVILSIHGAITRLTRATQKIADGRFDVPLEEHRRDEFGQLAREFQEMAGKLRELEQSRLDANPLTHLPGNRAIERELLQRMATGQEFAHLYVDLDHFKAYNDRYGYRKGSDVIFRTAELLRRAVNELGSDEDLLGHIGGDDYVVITATDRAEALANRIIELFDAEVPSFYSEEDRKAGSFKAHDRFGVLRKFPLMSMSIAIVCSDNISEHSPQAIGRECAKMKDHIKAKPGSNYLIDRRKR